MDKDYLYKESDVLSNPNILGDCSIGNYQPFVEFDMERDTLKP